MIQIMNLKKRRENYPYIKIIMNNTRIKKNAHYHVHIFLAERKKQRRRGYAVVIATIYWYLFFNTLLILIKVND